MSKSSPIAAKGLKAVLSLLLILWLGYVAVANYVLNDSAYREDFKLGDFQATWERGWSVVPGNIHLSSLNLSGFANGREWRAGVDSITASVSLLPLFRHRAEISSVKMENLDYFSRKVPSLTSGALSSKTGTEMGKTEQKGTQVASVQEPRHWDFVLHGLKITGLHTIESSKIKGKVEGGIESDLSYSSEDAKLQASSGTVELKTESLHSPRGDEIVKSALLNAAFRITPFNTKESRGKAALKFLTLQADLNAEMQTLEVFDRQLFALRRIHLEGKGKMLAHWEIANGRLMPGTSIKVNVADMKVSRDSYMAEGGGVLTATVDANSSDRVNIGIALKNYKASRIEEVSGKRKNTPLFGGSGLLISTHIPSEAEKLSIHDSGLKKNGTVHLQITASKLEDITFFNRYLPEKLPFALTGGSAEMSADIYVTLNDVKGTINLLSRDLLMQIDDRHISALLRINARINKGDPLIRRFDISGTTIDIEQARIATADVQAKSNDWNAGMTLSNAILIWEKPLKLKADVHLTAKDTKPLLALIEKRANQLSFVSKFLLARNPQGDFKINLDGRSVSIPEAQLKGGKLEIAFKSLFAPGMNSGAILFKHSGIRAFVGIKEKKVDIDIFNAQKSFDRYKIETP